MATACTNGCLIKDMYTYIYIYIIYIYIYSLNNDMYTRELPITKKWFHSGINDISDKDQK